MNLNNQDREWFVTLSARSEGSIAKGEMLPLRYAQGCGSCVQHDRTGFDW
jgi:hypothetical protein